LLARRRRTAMASFNQQRVARMELENGCCKKASTVETHLSVPIVRDVIAYLWSCLKFVHAYLKRVLKNNF
jgi:hypothetical protein